MSVPIVSVESIAASQKYSLIGGPFGSKLTSKDYVFKGVPVIRGANMGERYISNENLVFVTESKVNKDLFGNLAYPGDLIFTQRGTLGQVSIIPDKTEFQTYVISQSQMKLTLDKSKADIKYVYYYFSSNEARRKIINLDSSSGVPHINLTALKNFKIPLPNLIIQKGISAQLSAYDDLIENNKRRIALLEESARQLYKEWFVRFRFPGHEHVKNVDGVPEGWKVGCLGDVLELLGGFAFKSSSYTDKGNYGVVTIKNVHDSRFVPECQSRVEEIPDKMKQHCKLNTGDILLSLTGNVGRACIVYGNNYLLNQRVAKIKAKDFISKEFAYWTFTEVSMQRKVENLAYGVAQLNLSPSKLAAMEFTIPSLKLISEFSDITKPIFQQIITLNLSNQELARARDLLLPKLMSGELAV
ncbi:restriction endonuclease subunit S [Alteromonas genovensis]|uniref:restriction endonuclease subunit S n=1 Tax=Alteromonas genovensis TaxID=471225 RepID=UPI002FDFD643